MTLNSKPFRSNGTVARHDRIGRLAGGDRIRREVANGSSMNRRSSRTSSAYHNGTVAEFDLQSLRKTDSVHRNRLLFQGLALP